MLVTSTTSTTKCIWIPAGIHSPDTGNDLSLERVITISGLTDHDNVFWSSCGNILYSKKNKKKIALRTVLMTTMRTVLARVVTSTTAVGVSRVPTGGALRVLIMSVMQWVLSNLVTSITSIKIWIPAGIHSPGTDWGDIACYLGPNGNIFEDINFYADSVKDSYGFTLRIVVNTMIITAHIVLIPMEKLIEHSWVAMLMISAGFT